MGDNYGALLDLIRSGGSISRVELAVRSGLTEASVSRIVKQLLSDGVIAETGRGVSTGGKRPTLLQLDNASRHAIGLFIAETRVECVLTDLAGRVIASATSPGMAHQNRAALVTRAAESVDQLLIDARVDSETLLGIGVAVSGRQAFSGYATRVHPFDLAEWQWSLIERDLREATGRSISVENDSTCAAIGEFWSSRAPAAKDFGVVNISNGIGFGLVTGGDVYRGATSNVGEIGHMVLDVDGPECPCGNHGCLERLAAPPQIVDNALRNPGLVARLGLSGDGEDTLEDYDRIATAAVDGDDEARDLLTAAARYIGIALVSLTNVLDLERIVLTGPALDIAGQLVVDVVAAELQKRAYVRDIHPTEVRLADSGRHASAIGAAALVIHERLGAVRRPRELAIVG
ncbi:ROK family transcriptional regulator [Rathayibacter sp. VKM Ac-2927]|uniref:ROK family transcriptional regulator n=1 Tax=Rathayibacter sp. VKM Ac-2927 TaxID=2929478 RepID=UPI001FB35A42|nr:ROK family transcriptional regulator [Rathayibacter sp. VKM Ac-2927]MCJ1688353.1 ROK family transcriptional regulator [Rathayibacter sp. VKM Ac-2927]